MYIETSRQITLNSVSDEADNTEIAKSEINGDNCSIN